MNILKMIGVTNDEQSIRKVEKLVEVNLGDNPRNIYRDYSKEENKRRLKQDHKDKK